MNNLNEFSIVKLEQPKYYGRYLVVGFLIYNLKKEKKEYLGKKKQILTIDENKIELCDLGGSSHNNKETFLFTDIVKIIPDKGLYFF